MGFLVTKNKKIIEDLNIIFKKINFEELFNFQVDNEIHKDTKMINFIENLPYMKNFKNYFFYCQYQEILY